MSKKKIKSKVEARADEMRGMVPKDGGKTSREITPKFVRQCYAANVMGDGILYAALNKNRFVFCPQLDSWFEWRGHYWEKDQKKRHMAAVESVVDEYLIMAGATQQKIQKIREETEEAGEDPDNAVKGLVKYHGSILARVSKLRDSARRKNCIEFAWTNKELALVVSDDDFDQKPYLLACENGVIDLRTGEIHPGQHGDYITKHCNCEYHGIDVDFEFWADTLLDICGGRQEIVDYLQRFFGLVAIGEFIEKIFLILFGTNDNGKGVIVETIHKVLGDYSCPIPVEMLLVSGNNRSASGPSPDLVDLKGARFAFASEPSRGERFSDGRVKWLSGGDTIKCRAPHAKEYIRFEPSHTPVVMNNDIPGVPWEDEAYWSRAKVVVFPHCYVPDPDPKKPHEKKADPHIKKKLLKNQAGILAWIVQGALNYIENGLDTPEIIKEWTKQNRTEEDNFQPWIDECVIKAPGKQTPSNVLRDSFQDWWKANISNRVPSWKLWGKWMTAKGYHKEKHGIVYYYDIKVVKTSSRE